MNFVYKDCTFIVFDRILYHTHLMKVVGMDSYYAHKEN